MAKVPFRLHPIEFEGLRQLDAEPISVTRDLSGKMTLSSKFVAVRLKTIFEYIKKKNTTKIMELRSEEEIVLPTDTFLELAQAADAAEKNEQYWIVPVLGGFAIGALATIITVKEIPGLLYVPILIAAVLGFGAGYYWRLFYLKNKKKIDEFLKKIIEAEEKS